MTARVYIPLDVEQLEALMTLTEGGEEGDEATQLYEALKYAAKAAADAESGVGGRVFLHELDIATLRDSEGVVATTDLGGLSEAEVKEIDGRLVVYLERLYDAWAEGRLEVTS